MLYKSGFAAALLVCLGGSVLFSGPVAAADKNGSFAVRGAGALSCDTLLNLKEGDRPAFSQQLEEWVLGYVTAMNRQGGGTYDALVVQQVSVLPNMIAAVCKSNPAVSLEAVVFNILQRLQPAKIQTESPLVEAKVGTTSASVRKDTLIALQYNLQTLKLYSGKPNGEFGSETQEAIRKYQKSVSLPETGLPDSATVIRILVEQTPGAPTSAKSKR